MNHLSLTRRQLLGTAAALGASACMPRMLRQSRGADAFDWTLVSPASAGLSPQGLQALRTVVQQFIDRGELTGTVTAIARNGQLVWFEAQGVSDPVSGAPMSKDQLFRMMSSTKVVTAVAVLMMMEEGRLSIDDPVSRFVPAFANQKVAVAPPGATEASQVRLVPARRDITIKDLLTHTSGLSSAPVPTNGTVQASSSPAALMNRIERRPDDTLASYVSRLGAAALDFQPGSRWAYSPGDGFDVLMRIVEIVSGEPADAFLHERILEPLDMRDTWFDVPAREKDRVLPFYERENGAWVPRKSMLETMRPPAYISGAGGLFSTAHDFLNFELMLLNLGSLNGRRILKPQTVALMTQNHVGSLFEESIPPFTAGLGFGLGVRVVLDGQKVPYRGVGSFGWGGAYGTETWADPQLGIAGAVMPQHASAALAPAIQAALRRAIVA